MGGVFDPRVFSAETHHVAAETDREDEQRESEGLENDDQKNEGELEKLRRWR